MGERIVTATRLRDDQRLAAIEQSEGRKARYHIEALMIHAKRVLRAEEAIAMVETESKLTAEKAARKAASGAKAAKVPWRTGSVGPGRSGTMVSARPASA